MKNFLFVVSLLCIFSCTSKSAQFENERNSYIDSLKRELVELNKLMPYEDMKGNWMWSMDLRNDTIFIIRKIDSSIVYLNKRKVDMMENMSYEYLKNMANRLDEEDINLMQKNKIVIHCKFLVKETDSLLYKQTMTPEELIKSKKLLSLENNTGKSPLSYYKALFEQLNGALPRKVDNETTLVKITMQGNHLLYDYEIIEAYANNLKESLKVRSNRDIMKKELLSYVNFNRLTLLSRPIFV